MKYFVFFAFTTILSCYKPAKVQTSGPVNLKAEVKYFWPNGGFPYWYTMIDFSRPLPAKTEVTIKWDRVGENGQVIKAETHKATLQPGGPQPDVEQTSVRAQRTEKAENVRIVAVLCNDPSIQFTY